LFGYPLRQLQESYIVIVMAILLNISFVKWEDAKNTPAASANLILAYLLLAFVTAYPALQQCCLYRNRHRLRNRGFNEMYGAAYENLRRKKFLLYPLFFFYRRLILPIAIIYFDTSIITQFATLQLTGIATAALIIHQKPLEVGNRRELFEELSMVLISYHVLCFTQFVPEPAKQLEVGYSLLVCMALQLLVFFSVSLASRCRAQTQNLKIWLAKRALKSVMASRERPKDSENSFGARVRIQREKKQLAKAVKQAQESSIASLGDSSSQDSFEKVANARESS